MFEFLVSDYPIISIIFFFDEIFHLFFHIILLLCGNIKRNFRKRHIVFLNMDKSNTGIQLFSKLFSILIGTSGGGRKVYGNKNVFDVYHLNYYLNEILMIFNKIYSI